MPDEPVRFLALDRDFHELEAEYLVAHRDALADGRVVGGRSVALFEEALATRLGRRHVVAVASGSDAVWAALVACGVCAGDTVLLPAVSYIASGTAVLRAGAIPVFLDVDEHGHLRLEELRHRVRAARAKAVMAIGLYGDGLPDREIRAICAESGTPLVEDAAQSFGSRHESVGGGSLGCVSALSFAPTKNLACFGNAGAVACDDDGIATRLRALRVHGKSAEPAPALVGGNSQLATSHAAQLLVALRRFEQRQLARVRAASRYLAAIAELDWLEAPTVRRGCSHNWHKFVVRTDARDALARHLASRGVETQVHYAKTLPREPVLAAHAAGRGFPGADRLAERCLTLPLHPHLAESEVERVVSALRCFRSGA